MKINKDERIYIMHQVNASLKCETKFNDIINEFKKTKTYQEDLKPFEPVNLEINTYYRQGGNKLFLRAYKKQIIKETALKDIYTLIDCKYLLSTEDFTNTYNGINSIEDVKLMEKVVKAQDLPNKTDKAPVIEQIIRELVNELGVTTNYRDEIIDYIRKEY